MNPWPKHPIIYEINTWVWLQELSGKYGRPVTLATVPTEEWNYVSSATEYVQQLPGAEDRWSGKDVLSYPGVPAEKAM